MIHKVVVEKKYFTVHVHCTLQPQKLGGKYREVHNVANYHYIHFVLFKMFLKHIIPNQQLLNIEMYKIMLLNYYQFLQ